MALSNFWRPVSVAQEPLSEERFALVMDGDHKKCANVPTCASMSGWGSAIVATIAARVRIRKLFSLWRKRA